MKNTTKLLILFLALFFAITSYGQTTEWSEPTQTSKPWTRWWWPNNAVDKENIKRELQEFADAGIGGVEITPIYGVKGEENRTIEFLSPEFADILTYTVEEANKVGLGVDMPPGTGWRCGGPFVPVEKGLWNLQVEKYKIKKGRSWEPEVSKNIAAVSFVAKDGEKRKLQSDEKFIADKSGTVYVALRKKSSNKVKRPAKGGEGWAIDTFNKDITDWYLSEFWNRLGIDEGKLRCFFHDSFEYTGDFTTNFLEEFKKRRGYELTEYIHVLAKDCKDKEIVARVKSDYRETLADLVLESFIQPMTDWANKHKSLNRNQAHGSPGNILDLYAACDIPETEFFGRIQSGNPKLYIQKFASSAAHVTGQKLVSSESYTWLEEHWTVTPSDMVRATNRFFLAGINHMFFHGTCYSPKDDPWPGWLFYASTQINNRNPLWREMPTLFKYIERTQNILQNSTPKNDVLVYWPYFDVAAEEGNIFNHIGVSPDTAWFYGQPIARVADRLTNSGYTFDFISDKQLLKCKTDNGHIVTSGRTKYKAIVVPKTVYIPLNTMETLLQFINNGGVVVFDNSLPVSVPGIFQYMERESKLKEMQDKINSSNVGDVVHILSENNIVGETDLLEKGFRFLKMTRHNEDWYLIFNLGNETKHEWIKLNSDAKSYVLMDPMTGAESEAETFGDKVRIRLDQEKIVFVRCFDAETKIPVFVYHKKDKKSDVEGLLWKVEFLEGGPVYPGNLQMDDLISWTKMGDQQAQRFTGTVRYSTEFIWDKDNRTAIIELGVVKDCARIKLNEKVAGTALGPVYKIRADNLVKGKNKLVIEVTNVAANRIRDLDRRGVVWRKFKDINLVNIDYEPYDASNWEVKDAGLLGPVKIYAN